MACEISTVCFNKLGTNMGLVPSLIQINFPYFSKVILFYDKINVLLMLLLTKNFPFLQIIKTIMYFSFDGTQAVNESPLMLVPQGVADSENS